MIYSYVMIYLACSCYLFSAIQAISFIVNSFNDNRDSSYKSEALCIGWLIAGILAGK